MKLCMTICKSADGHINWTKLNLRPTKLEILFLALRNCIRSELHTLKSPARKCLNLVEHWPVFMYNGSWNTHNIPIAICISIGQLMTTCPGMELGGVEQDSCSSHQTLHHKHWRLWELLQGNKSVPEKWPIWTIEAQHPHVHTNELLYVRVGLVQTHTHKPPPTVLVRSVSLTQSTYM